MRGLSSVRTPCFSHCASRGERDQRTGAHAPPKFGGQYNWRSLHIEPTQTPKSSTRHSVPPLPPKTKLAARLMHEARRARKRRHRAPRRPMQPRASTIRGTTWLRFLYRALTARRGSRPRTEGLHPTAERPTDTRGGQAKRADDPVLRVLSGDQCENRASRGRTETWGASWHGRVCAPAAEPPA